MLFKYAWRGFVRRRTRTSLAIAGITLSIGLLVAVVSVSSSVEHAIAESLGAAGADMVVQRRVAECPFAHIKLPKDLAEIPADVVKKISSLEQVEAASGVLLLWAFYQATPATPTHPIVVAGVDPTMKTIGPVRISNKTEEEKAAPGTAAIPGRSDAVSGPSDEKEDEDEDSCCAVTQGRYLTRYDDRAVMLTEEYAQKKKYQVGDKINIGPTDLFKVIGLVDLSGSARIGEAEAFIPLKTAQAMYGQGPIVDTIFVALKSARDKRMVSDIIRTWIEPQPHDPPQTSITTSENVDAGTSAVANLTRRSMFGLSIMVLIFALLLIVRNAVSTVAERVNEVGLMRAIGWRRMDVSRLFLAEELIGGAIGGVAGCLLGWGLALAFSQFADLKLPSALSSFPPCSETQPPLALPLSTTPSLMVFVAGLAIALLIGSIAGLAASHRAARLDPADALRRL